MGKIERIINKGIRNGFIHRHCGKFLFFSCPSVRQKKVALYKLSTSNVTQFKNVLSKLKVDTKGVFLDVGGNIGYFSLLLAKCMPDSEILTFEPVESNFAILCSNTSKIENIRRVPLALNDRSILIGFGMPEKVVDGNTGLYSSVNKSRVSAFGWSTRLDNVWESELLKHQKISYIKLDVEGMELSALRGMKKVLVKMRPVVRVSLNTAEASDYRLDVNGIIDFIQDLDGYMAYDVDGNQVELTYMQELQARGKNGVIQFAPR